MTSAFASRCLYTPYHKKLVKAEELVGLFKNGMNVGWSGFTGVGYPKAVPIALADHVEKHNLQGKLKMNLFIGASTGPETEDRWAKLDMIDRRTPHQVGKNIQKGINTGKIRFQDRHLSNFTSELMYGYLTPEKKPGEKPLDIAIIEANEITADGYIIPGASVGGSPEVLAAADKIIIELNTRNRSMIGLHDITEFEHPPFRKPLMCTNVKDKMGTPYIKIDPSRVVGIVHTDLEDTTTPNLPADDQSEAIAGHIISFFEHEVRHGRMPSNLLPIQSGIGNIANAVIGGLIKSPFTGLNVWTEVMQDTFLDLFQAGKCDFATTTAIRLSPEGFTNFFDNYDFYKERILIRNQSVTNSAEMARRLGLIAMNTPVEFDMYGHANSTLVNGSRMLNGLGGSGDFLRNAKYSMMHVPSVRPTKTDPVGITSIVPKAAHVDHTEHDLDIFITEQGLADLRGLTPVERAREIIDKCAHPAYKDQLTDYLNMSIVECTRKKSLHEPHMLDKCYKMYTNLEKNGTMRIDNWN